MGFSQKQNFDPRRSGADAAAYLEDEMGMKYDSQGNIGPTRDYGRDMMLGSQQRNSLSRGTPGGYASGLGKPLNSNLTPRGFADNLQQRNQVMSREQRIAQAQQDGTFGTIRDKFNTDNAGAGLSMNRFGNIRKMNPMNEAPARSIQLNDVSDEMGRRSEQEKLIQPPSVARTIAPPAPNQQEMNRAGLQDRAAGLRLLREMSQTPLQIDRSAGGGSDTLIQGKYGKGFAANLPAGTKRPPGDEGLIGGRPFSEVMQGLANRQAREGTWREGDRLPNAAAGEESSSYDRNTRAGMMSKDQAKKANEESRQTILSRQRTKK
jgi:hypothetical protein